MTARSRPPGEPGDKPAGYARLAASKGRSGVRPRREETMKNDRRTFLKTAALAGAAATSGLGGLTTPAAARTGAARAGTQELPKGMTFATLRQGSEYGLGIRTERGVLDVVKAESELSEGAPTTINAVLESEGDMAALTRLIDKARMAGGERFFVPENAAEFGPCVTDPEKIICIGLNYRKHAAETGNPVPTLPILFNKFNSALNHHGGTIPLEGARREVRLRGRARHRHRAGGAQRQRGGGAELHLRLRHRQRLHGARSPE